MMMIFLLQDSLTETITISGFVVWAYMFSAYQSSLLPNVIVTACTQRVIMLYSTRASRRDDVMAHVC